MAEEGCFVHDTLPGQRPLLSAQYPRTMPTTAPPSALDPTTFIIFGATGDLSRRKLLPALYSLYRKGYLPPSFQVVGLAKEKLTTKQFRDFAADLLTPQLEYGSSARDAFVEHVHYQQGEFEEPNTYAALAENLAALENTKFNRCSNKLFYLAVAPRLYETIFRQLATSGLTIPCGGPDGWTRVLVEKPFGHDLATAQRLDHLLGTLFKEEQIFRIDHYLAKETLQNILAFRFSNALFETVWNREHIDKVEITFLEKSGIGTRGSFYEDIGALRDVGQNHLLQMLALIAMEEPNQLDAQAIREERTRVLQALRPVTVGDLKKESVRGQYVGYRDEAHTATASQVETYFRLRAYVDTPRWQGVPFYLESGKKMHTDEVAINIFFKETASRFFPAVSERHHQNLLTFRIQPHEGISLVFWAKKPGFTMELEGKKLSFAYADTTGVDALPDAYEHVLYDAIRGDQTRFASTAEVAAAWNFITPILAHWTALPLHLYQPGARAVAAPAAVPA